MTCKKVRKKAPERHFTNLEQTISLSKKILDSLPQNHAKRKIF